MNVGHVTWVPSKAESLGWECNVGEGSHYGLAAPLVQGEQQAAEDKSKGVEGRRGGSATPNPTPAAPCKRRRGKLRNHHQEPGLLATQSEGNHTAKAQPKGHQPKDTPQGYTDTGKGTRSPPRLKTTTQLHVIVQRNAYKPKESLATSQPYPTKTLRSFCS